MSTFGSDLLYSVNMSSPGNVENAVGNMLDKLSHAWVLDDFALLDQLVKQGQQVVSRCWRSGIELASIGCSLGKLAGALSVYAYQLQVRQDEFAIRYFYLNALNDDQADILRVLRGYEPERSVRYGELAASVCVPESDLAGLLVPLVSNGLIETSGDGDTAVYRLTELCRVVLGKLD